MTPPTDKRGIWVVVALLLIVGYLIFIFSKSVWRNYEVNNQVLNLEEDIEELQIKQEYFENLIAYFETASFAEKEARSKLGLKKEGETVLALPRSAQFETKNEEKIDEGVVEEKSNYQKWWHFFFR